MPYLGNIVNFLAVFIAGILGAFIKRGIPERIIKAVTAAVGISIIYIGIDGALVTAPPVAGIFESAGLVKFIIMILSLVIGTIIGELIDIDRAVNKLGAKLEEKFVKDESAKGSFAKGFVASTVMISVGAMAVNGAILDAVGDPSTLIAKATIDFIACFMLAASLGIGVAFSAFPMLIYQGALTLIAMLFVSAIPEATITYLAATGSLIIVFIGTNFLGITSVKTANMTPALFVPFALAPLFDLIGLL